MILLVVIGLLVMFVVKFCWSRRELYMAASKMHGPTALVPILGNSLHFLCKDEDILYVIYNISSKYPSPARLWLGPVLMVCTADPNHVEKIMTSTKFSYKHDLYDFVKNYLGNGLVSGSGPVYKKHKKIIQPMFGLKFVTAQTDLIQRHSEICMSNLEKLVDTGTFDVHHTIHKCFVDIIGECILGTDMECQKNGYSEFCKAAIDMYGVGFTRLTRPWLHPDILYNLTSIKKREDRIIKIIRNFISSIVTDSWKKRMLTDYTVTESSPIVDQIGEYIGQNPDSINCKDFVSHLLTLYAASEDTMTIISSFLAVCFGMYPEYQNKAAEEIRTVFGDKPRAVTYDDIANLPYLDSCIKEAQRLFPIAPYILRQPLETVHIDKNVTIPKGTCLVVPIFNLHRDPEKWENPDHFHPDHFLPEQVKSRHQYSFIPFSAGPRGCIGKILANAILKIFMCNFLQRFEVEADGKLPDLKLKMDISVRPINGYNIRLKKRVWK